MLTLLLINAANIICFLWVRHSGAFIPSYLLTGWFALGLFSFLFVIHRLSLFLMAVIAKRFRRHSFSVKKVCQVRLSGRWCCLYDQNDEAIRGLGSAHKIQPNIYTAEFGIGLINYFMILITAIVFTLWVAFYELEVRLVLLSVYVLASVVFVMGAILNRHLVSACDRITWAAMKQSVFGVDTIGETAHRVAHHPEWMEVGFNPLPADLSKQINDFSDEAAAKSIPKLRGAIEDLIKLYSVADPNKSVAEYLTWDELVHTSYFQIPRFRKLVYYIIANSEGFKPTQAFLDDPDYKLAERWHQEIQPTETNALG